MRRPTPLTTARIGVLALAIAALAPSPAPALGDSTAPLYAKMKQRFTTTKAGAWTGWSFDGALQPFAPGLQPPPQRGATSRHALRPERRAQLRRIRRMRPAPELHRNRRGDHPRRPRRLPCGLTGRLRGGLPLPRSGGHPGRQRAPVHGPSRAGARPHDRRRRLLRILRATVHRNRLNATIPPLALPGGIQAAITRLSLKTPRGGTRQHPGLRTPRTCPRSGRRTFTYRARYDEPHGVQRSTNSTRCAGTDPPPTPQGAP